MYRESPAFRNYLRIYRGSRPGYLMLSLSVAMHENSGLLIGSCRSEAFIVPSPAGSTICFVLPLCLRHP